LPPPSYDVSVVLFSPAAATRPSANAPPYVTTTTPRVPFVPVVVKTGNANAPLGAVTDHSSAPFAAAVCFEADRVGDGAERVVVLRVVTDVDEVVGTVAVEVTRVEEVRGVVRERARRAIAVARFGCERQVLRELGTPRQPRRTDRRAVVVPRGRRRRGRDARGDGREGGEARASWSTARWCPRF